MPLYGVLQLFIDVTLIVVGDSKMSSFGFTFSLADISYTYSVAPQCLFVGPISVGLTPHSSFMAHYRRTLFFFPKCQVGRQR